MRRDGFTIIELMLGSLLVGMVMVFTLQTFVTNNHAYTQIDSVVGSQQALRVIAQVIEKDVRHAGMMVPEAGAICAIDNDTAPDIVYLSDRTAVDPNGSTTPYAGADVTSGASVVGPGPVTLTLDDLILEGVASGAAYDTDGNGTNDSDFQVGGGVIVFDASTPSRGTACGRITAVNLGAKEVTATFATAAMTVAAGGYDMFAVPAIELRISNQTLFRNGLRLADGIEDMQFAFYFDVNGNNLIDPGEVRGDGTGADYVANANDNSDLREVRFNVLARSRQADAGFTAGHFQALENRDPVAGQDGFRRRVYTNTVRVRNVGDRGVGA